MKDAYHKEVEKVSRLLVDFDGHTSHQLISSHVEDILRRLAIANEDVARLTKLGKIIGISDGGTLMMGGTCYFALDLKKRGRKALIRLGSGEDLRDAIDDAEEPEETE